LIASTKREGGKKGKKYGHASPKHSEGGQEERGGGEMADSALIYNAMKEREKQFFPRGTE